MSSTHELRKSDPTETKAEDIAADQPAIGDLSSIAADTTKEPVAPKEAPKEALKQKFVATANDGEEKIAQDEPASEAEQSKSGDTPQWSIRSDSKAVLNNATAGKEEEEESGGEKESVDKLSEATSGLLIHIPEAPSSQVPGVDQQTSTLEPPPPPLPKDEKFLAASKSPRLEASEGEKDPEKEAIKASGPGSTDGEKEGAGEQVFEDDQQSEIASIMEQFEDGMGGPGEAEIMSPRLEIGQPMFGSPTHPPRKSSLEPLRADTPDSLRKSQTLQSPPPRSSSLITSSPVASLKQQSNSHETPESPLTPVASKHLPPPPQPDPEPDLPFDFHRFLEQLRHRTADPVAKFLRSFLLEFAKKQWMVHEQVKIISDFLEFITKKMSQCDVWRTVSDAEFDNAREGMEKLVMNRLYTQTFSPALPPPEPSPAKGKRRAGGPSSPLRPGRRGQHQEDVERDEVLAQKVRIYGWVKEEHLDIPPIGDKGRKFMHLAQQELLKIKSYRAPRDKVICVLNCCKVIFGFLRNAQHDQSADSFVPLLIFVVLQANPDHLVSNLQYILRFRHQDKLGGEAGYYISSLMGAVQFIENLDRTSLTISDADFEANVEAAVSAIAERHNTEEEQALKARGSPHLLPSGEKSSISRPEVTPRNSLEAEQSSPRRSTSLKNNNTKSDDEGEENAAVAGLLRTIQRPLSTIGRIFSDDNSASTSTAQNPPQSLTPQAINTPRLSPAPRNDEPPTSEKPRPGSRGAPQPPPHPKLNAEDAAARQASAEAEEARKIRLREEGTVVETLSGMFPQLDRDVILDVVRANEGRVGKAVDACLALSAS